MSFSALFAASRRVFILRLLVESQGKANESVIHTCAMHGVSGQTSRDDIRSDLDHLKKMGCLSEEWLGTIRVVSLTERGEDAAYGRIEVDGVEHSIWRK